MFGVKKQKNIRRKRVNARFDNFVILLKLNNLHRFSLKKVQVTLKEKYSFFNHFSHRKTILKKLLRVSSYSIKAKLKDTILKLSNSSLLPFYKNNVTLKSQSAFGANLNDFNVQRVRFKPGYQVI